jgi:uncharacterized membrane protein (UPF0182 family)
MTTPNPLPGGNPRFLIWILFFFFAIAIANQMTGIYMENLWYESTGYGSVYWTRLGFQVSVFAAFGRPRHHAQIRPAL